MKLCNGVWLTEKEEHLLGWAKHQDWRYQGEKLDAVMRYVKKFDVAIDIGAHVGLWSKELVKKFALVVAFEPIEIHRECFVKNVKGKYELHPYALGNKDGSVTLSLPEHSTGGTRVSPERGGEWDRFSKFNAELKLLDDIYQGPCDLMKVDCEGYEEFVLRGGRKLLETHKPVVIVEQKNTWPQDYGLEPLGAVRFLKKIGYTQREELGGDYIMTFG